MDVQGAAVAPAEPWLPSPPYGFSFPAQMAEVGGASSSSQAAGAAGADVSAVSGVLRRRVLRGGTITAVRAGTRYESEPSNVTPTGSCHLQVLFAS